jgi:hypothetical protein
MQALEELLTAKDTGPMIQQSLLQGLHSWRHQLPLPQIPNNTADSALVEQNIIGWKQLLEGLPSSKWALLQDAHYRNHPVYNSKGQQIRRTGTKWILAVLQQLHKTWRDMWRHRNDIKHRTERPRQKAQEHVLNLAIAEELLRGPENLPALYHPRFQHPGIDLLARSLTYKQAWLANITTARQRQARIEAANNDLQTISQERSALLKWMSTGRAT